ncbi:hypothetical protein [Gemmatimonas sp.]|jgi:hypothetical protein|uniref:hypothetical protein n=1 Tax=Gemmatimonas sp. TaxID=1962908 RepID=UPI0037BE3077
MADAGPPDETTPPATDRRAAPPKPAGDGARFTTEEEQQLRAAVRDGTPPSCPRCEVRMTHRPIGGGSFGLGYHRQREWLLCPSCRRSAIFDVRRGTRL